jgi:hypothetical protein
MPTRDVWMQSFCTDLSLGPEGVSRISYALNRQKFLNAGFSIDSFWSLSGTPTTPAHLRRTFPGEYSRQLDPIMILLKFIQTDEILRESKLCADIRNPISNKMGFAHQIHINYCFSKRHHLVWSSRFILQASFSCLLRKKKLYTNWFDRCCWLLLIVVVVSPDCIFGEKNTSSWLLESFKIKSYLIFFVKTI